MMVGHWSLVIGHWSLVIKVIEVNPVNTVIVLNVCWVHVAVDPVDLNDQ